MPSPPSRRRADGLTTLPDVAIVCGRRKRQRASEASSHERQPDRHASRLLRFTPGALLLVTAAVFAAFVLRNAFVAAHQIVGWIVACSIVALLIDPLVNLVQRILPRVLSVVVVVITMFVFLVVVVTGLARELVDSLDDLEEAAPRAAKGLEDRYEWAATST